MGFAGEQVGERGIVIAIWRARRGGHSNFVQYCNLGLQQCNRVVLHFSRVRF